MSKKPSYKIGKYKDRCVGKILASMPVLVITFFQMSITVRLARNDCNRCEKERQSEKHEVMAAIST